MQEAKDPRKRLQATDACLRTSKYGDRIMTAFLAGYSVERAEKREKVVDSNGRGVNRKIAGESEL